MSGAFCVLCVVVVRTLGTMMLVVVVVVVVPRSWYGCRPDPVP